MTRWLDRLLAARMAADPAVGHQVTPAPLIRMPLLKQAWQKVTFVSWRYDRSVLQPMLPPGLVVDEHDGSAWVTLVLLRLAELRLPGAPAMPLLSSFAQTNLRTYVRGPGDVPGVWFFAVDAGRLWITAGARVLLGAPYFLAREDIAAAEDGRTVRYTGIRHARRPPAACKVVVRPGDQVEADERDLWLTHRWYAYTRHAGVLMRNPVSHKAWPLRTARLVTVAQTLTTAAALPEPASDPNVRFSDGVADVALGLPRPVSSRCVSRVLPGNHGSVNAGI